MNILGSIRQWRHNRQCQAVLNNLPDAILHDVGLVRNGKKVSTRR